MTAVSAVSASSALSAPSAVAAVAATAAPSAVSAVSRADVQRLLELLQPRALTSDLLVRIGDDQTGWSLPAAALNSARVVAFGHRGAHSGGNNGGSADGNNAGSGLEPDLPSLLAARGARLWRCDGRIDAATAPDDAGHQLLSLLADGAEWDALAGADAALIGSFDTVVAAFHGLAALVNRDFFDRAEAVFTRLAATHQVVHLAARQAGGVVSLGQQPFPCVLDTTWVRRRGAHFGGPAPTAPATPVFDQLVQAATPQRTEPHHGFALFPTLRQLHLPAPRGVLQVGASYGQEMREFLEGGIQAGVFIEPLPEPFRHLAGVCAGLPNFIPVNALCSNEAGREHDFHVASNGGMSSSILKPANHLQVNDYVSFPTTVRMTSTTLDDVVDTLRAQGHGAVVASLDLLFMDTQGAEFRILLGATRTLRQFKYLYFEVMRNDMYEGQTPFLGYCHYLEAMGFTLNDVYFHHPEQTGNALFIRQDLVAVGS